MDDGLASSPTTPKTAGRTPATPRSPVPGPESPFVTIRSGKHRSPPTSPTSNVRNSESTSQSISRLTRGTASAKLNAISPSRDRPGAESILSSISSTMVAGTSSAPAQTVEMRSMVEHVLDHHGVLHLAANASLILRILSTPSDSNRLDKELENIGVPRAIISAVRRAFVLDCEEGRA